MAKDKLFGSIMLHTQPPVYKDKVWVCSGTSFDIPKESSLEILANNLGDVKNSNAYIVIDFEVEHYKVEDATKVARR